MNRERRRRELQLKSQLEKLEIRWLMRSSPFDAAVDPLVAAAQSHRISTQVEQWLDHHPSAAAAPLDLKQQKAVVAMLVPQNSGEWGTLRVLARLEAGGDHRFDTLYQRISARYDHWAVGHPLQARLSGVTAAPLEPISTAGNIGSTGDVEQSGAAANPLPSLVGTSPAGRPPPPINYLVDTVNMFENCNCGGTVDELLNGTNDPEAGPGGGSGSGGGSSGGGGSGTSAGTGVGYEMQNSPMDSDASVISGEFYQSHQLATYQSQGVLRGIDLDYSSLEADPYPVVTAFLTTASGSNSASVTSITASMTIDGISQGSAVTYNSVSLTDGATYIVQLDAADVSTLATGIYTADLTITKYFSGGSNFSHTYSEPVMIVNDASSPYGAGWTLGGLQQITVGTAGSSLMITSGSERPRGVHFDRRHQLQR